MSLNPGYLTVEGLHQMTDGWSVDLPMQFNRRIEDGPLVLWRPGFTVWADAYGNDHSRSSEERLDEIRGDSSSDAYDEITETDGNVLRYSYRL